MSIKTFCRHTGFLMKIDISDVSISPTTGLDIIVVVQTSGFARR